MPLDAVSGSVLGLPFLGAEEWPFKRSDLQRALDQAGRSAPGPDGIPYLAYQKLGSLALDVLWGALRQLSSEDAMEALAAEAAVAGDSPDAFNLGLLAFLPKTPSAQGPGGESIRVAGDVRPLTIVNCDNRLGASAVRLRIEPILERWVSKHQRGFFGGRSMLENVVDVDECMAQTALRGGRGAAIFFDFAAAFPSLGHAYLMNVLRHLGLPPWLLRYVRALYANNKCVL